MDIVVSKDYKELSKDVAEHVAQYIRNNPRKLLCFAAGNTPLGMFSELIEKQKEEGLNLSCMYYVGLDEWVGLGYEDKGSCRQVMFDHFYNAAGIPKEQILTFDGKDDNLQAQCKKVDVWVSVKGGIGLTVLGIGMNGHIGFNEPGLEISEQSIIVDLDNITLDVGRKYFNGSNCPVKGISLGLGQLLKADRAVLMANGEKKSDIVKRALEGEATPMVPASVMQKHNACCCFLDKGAASGLQVNV